MHSSHEYTRRRVRTREEPKPADIMVHDTREEPRVLGANPRGEGACPRCGKQFKRIAMHLRSCDGTRVV